jgi:hypothetical protein
MSAAAVLPFARTITVPNLSRERRRTEIERLSEDYLFGIPPSPAAVRVLLAAFAAGRPDLEAMWGDFIGEARRVQAVEAGDEEYRDLQPGLASQDYEAALNDLLDGTTTYHGERTS